MKYFNKIILNINIVLICLSLFAHFAPAIDPVNFWPAAIIGLAFPIIIFMNILFIFYWILVKPKYALYSIFCLLIASSSIFNMITFHIEKEVKTHDGIKIMSFNIKNGGEIYHRDKRKRKAAVDHFLKSFKKYSNQDIICLQEVGGFARDLIGKIFPTYQQIKMDGIGTMILSNNKIIDQGKLQFLKTNNSCIWADIIMNFDTVRVYSVHLQSNQIKENDVTQLENVSQEYKKSLKEVKGIFGKYRYHNRKRSEQVKILRKHLDNSPYPVIVCGDLNEPPQSYVYCQLADVLCDSFTKRGNGMGATYAGKIPFLRIDYILTDPYFEVLHHRRILERYSDHYPLLAIIRHQISK